MAMRATVRKRRSGQSGQAAVEAVFSIPVMLVLFLIGFELFAITWNAQYVHVRSRYEILYEANHAACGSRGRSQTLSGNFSPTSATVTARATSDMTLWSRNRPTAYQIRQKATIVCK